MNRIMKWFWTVVVMAAVCGCTKTEYITVERVTHDTTYVAKHQRDSIWLHDSIRVSEKGDTIPAPYPVTEYVEKPLAWWQKGLIWIGIIALMIIIVVVVWKLKRFLPIR